MTRWLLDTNFVSELRRSHPNARVLDFVERSDLDRMYLSVVVMAELRFGVLTAREAARRDELDRWLTYTIRPMFAGRVLTVTEQIVLRWRFMVEDSRKVGRSFSAPDLLIAATAIEHELTLVTRNVKDFAGLGVTILNPWE